MATKRPPIKAVIFDWAGTTVDFGSLAPVKAFEAAFKDAGIAISVEEIRRPMGLAKRQHLAELLRDGAVRSRWNSRYGADPEEGDIDRLYHTFNRHLLDLLPHYADPVPGTLEVIATLRSRGVKIGSNSGYSLEEMRMLAQAARERGYEPDCIVSASEVAAGRPAPDLSLKCLERLGLDRNSPALKVDDTGAGIEEGRNAGFWTVAVAVSGNEVGLSLNEWSALAHEEQAALRERARVALQPYADYVIDSVADLPRVIEVIQQRIAAGEKPKAQ